MRRMLMRGADDVSTREWTKIADYEIQDGDTMPINLTGLPGYTEIHVECTHLYGKHETTASQIRLAINGIALGAGFAYNKKPVNTDVNTSAERADYWWNGLFWDQELMGVSVNRDGYCLAGSYTNKPYHVIFGVGPAESIKMENKTWPLQCGRIEIWAR